MHGSRTVIGLATIAPIAGSVALAGFGFDSVIEILASAVVIWKLKWIRSEREQPALCVIAAAFFVLAIYVLIQARAALLTGARPASSPLGVAWLAITLVVMLLLARGKRVTGQRLGNLALTTEARSPSTTPCWRRRAR